MLLRYWDCFFPKRKIWEAGLCETAEKLKRFLCHFSFRWIHKHSLASYPVYFSHISWLTVSKLGSILCELLSASLVTSFDVYSLTAYKSLHLLVFLSSEGGWHTFWYWSWIWSSVLLLVWAWPNNLAGCSLREYKHDITLGYHEMMNTGIRDKDIKRK